MLILATLAAATLVSEDLALVAAGALVAEGAVTLPGAIIACAIGIVVGDAGLWCCGRYARRVNRFLPRWGRRVLASRLADWVRDHAGASIVASRFLPGARLPLYVTAGASGLPLRVFLCWSAVAVSLWTPLVVSAAAGIGESSSLLAGADSSPWLRIAAALLVIPAIGTVRRLLTPSWRVRAAARLARWSRWEFWPMWAFYMPVAVWILLLALRHRSLTVFTAANPAIPDGGTVGESKFEILERLPAWSIVPSVRICAGEGTARVRDLLEQSSGRGWALPLVLKPDVGQRGVGVKLVRTWDDAAMYLRAVSGAVLAQPYDPGPFEAGVFYYRLPGHSNGRILSITDKVFPELVGDGVSTVETLIWGHPRFRLQARTFLARHRDAASRVLVKGERMRLALAGNHAQGTTFRDGAHLLTPALELRIDEIARHRPGFFIGRFDIRYRSVDAFKAGRDFAIVELNGATAESTNIYDPSRSLLSAYRVLCEQWALVFAIGAANRRDGARATSLSRLMTLVRAHMTTPVAFQISD